MEKINISAQMRNEKGKGVARRLRADGEIPAVFYGHKTDSFKLSVDAKNLRTILNSRSGGNAFFNLTFDGQKRWKNWLF